MSKVSNFVGYLTQDETIECLHESLNNLEESIILPILKDWIQEHNLEDEFLFDDKLDPREG
jgi:hypothetical protein